MNIEASLSRASPRPAGYEVTPRLVDIVLFQAMDAQHRLCYSLPIFTRLFSKNAKMQGINNNMFFTENVVSTGTKCKLTLKCMYLQKQSGFIKFVKFQESTN